LFKCYGPVLLVALSVQLNPIWYVTTYQRIWVILNGY